MKNLFKLAILSTFLTFSLSVYADVKVKIRQTVSGQSFENTTFIKGKRQRSEQNMGEIQTVNITQCDLKRDLQLMPMAKSYTVNVWGTPEQVAPAPTQTVSVPKEKGGLVTMIYTIKDTGERKKMFGYEARHLIITMETNSSPDACNKTKSKTVTDGWYIDATFALDCDLERNATFYRKPTTGGCQDRFETKQSGTGKRGYAVYEKMTMYDENGKESTSIINEVLELSKATLEDSLFEVPADYKQVKDSSEMFAAMTSSMMRNSGANDSGMNSNIQNLSKSENAVPSEIGAKKEGVIRFGLANVQVGAVGDGLTTADLAGAVQNALNMFLKIPNMEVVALGGTSPSAIETEAKQKDCDYIIFANASHKKGGGGFGMFKAIAPTLGNIVGGVAKTGGKMKAKDEITLDIKLQSTGGAIALSKQYKAKAKADGEDIVSIVSEQAAQAIMETVKK